MNPNRLQVGIDFSQKRADFCLLFPDGQPLLSHQAFANSRLGYQKARQMLLDSLQAYSFAGGVLRSSPMSPGKPPATTGFPSSGRWPTTPNWAPAT